MGNATLTQVLWTVAACSGLFFHLVIVYMAALDWRAVPKTAPYEATMITARANLRLFVGLALVQLCWGIAGLTAMLSIVGDRTETETLLIIGGLMLPSFVLPSLALLELLDRRKASMKLREAVEARERGILSDYR
jgi:hypothetical protein